MGGGPSVPSAPAPPAAPKPNDEAARQELAMQRRRRAAAKGTSSTIATSPTGLMQSADTGGAKSLGG